MCYGLGTVCHACCTAPGDALFGLAMCCIGSCGGRRKYGHDTENSPVDLTWEQKRLLRDSLFWGKDTRFVQPNGTSGSMPKYNTTAQAHEFLLRGLNARSTMEQGVALQRLGRAYSIQKDQLTPSLLLQIIPDLDTVLFNRLLSRRLRVTWSSTPKRNGKVVCGSTKTKTSTTHSRLHLPFRHTKLVAQDTAKQLSSSLIELNKACFFTDSKAVLWGTVVHEMLHAFIDQATAKVPRLEGRACSARGEHDDAFVATAETMADKLGFESLGKDEIVGVR
jgi:hypothetical protein